MTAFKMIAAAIFLASAPAHAEMALPEMGKSFSFYEAVEDSERLSFHNRCVAAATYAMHDGRYTESEARAEYHRQLLAGEAIVRRVASGQRAIFVSDIPTSQEYAGIYRSLGWGKQLRAMIKQEFEGCKSLRLP